MDKVETKVKQVVEVNTSIDEELCIFIGHNLELFDRVTDAFTNMHLLQMECCVEIGIKNGVPHIAVKLSPDFSEINKAKDMAPVILKNIVSTLKQVYAAVMAFAKAYHPAEENTPSVEEVVLGS